jgi:pimeloyl-ACP methyl ester carboxylesterase
MKLANITVPTLILAHESDECHLTPPANAGKLRARLTKAAKVDVVILDGGAPPESGTCKAKSAHGYFGIEDRAVRAIADFVKANSK